MASVNNATSAAPAGNKRPRSDAHDDANDDVPLPHVERPRRPPPSAPVTHVKEAAPEENDDEYRPLVFPYRCNFNDHFETSIEALRDLMPVIDALRTIVRPNCPSAFTLYDPYYCAGTVKEHWMELGISKVIHEKRDFYKDVEEGTVPCQYDMLVTNPPYSDDHIQQLLGFLIGSNKPWAFLVPDYIASKEWYKALISSCFQENLVAYRGQNIFCGSMAPATVAKRTAATGIPFVSTIPMGIPTTTAVPQQHPLMPGYVPPTTTVGVEPFYVVPKCWYDFKHPLGAGHDASHFKSIWFVWCGRRTNEVLRAVTCAMTASPSPSGASVITGLAGLREGHHVRVEGRKNPKQRAKERQRELPRGQR